MLVWVILKSLQLQLDHQILLELEHIRKMKLSQDLFQEPQQELFLGLPMEENWKSSEQLETFVGEHIVGALLLQVTNFLQNTYTETGFTAMNEIETEQITSSTLVK
jgi:hypothetical protein